MILFDIILPIKYFALIAQYFYSTLGQGSSESLNATGPCMQTEDTTFLYYNQTGECYPANMVNRGPCGDLELFVEDSDRLGEGFCICDDVWTENDGSFPGPESCARRRPRIEFEGKCYSVFHQGPCDKDHWLVLNPDDQPECQKNPCLDQYIAEGDSDPNDPYFWFTHEGSCYKTFTQGFCRLGRFLTFDPSISPIPYCSLRETRLGEDLVGCYVNMGIGTVGANFRCKSGEKKNSVGKCQITTKWDVN